jgi:dTDP-4-amino-4,6-dideoxygalactose transaminase
VAEIRMITNKRHLKKEYLVGKNKFNILEHLKNDNRYFFTANVRGGLGGIIDVLALNKNDAVLMPALVPEGLLSPFRKKQIRILHYQSDKHLKMDINSILTLIQRERSIKAIVIIHYFGIPQDIDKLTAICRENSIFILEDCVHGLFSRYDDGLPIGTKGDISFFSLPKFLPVPDGGLFFIIDAGRFAYSFSILHKLSVFFHFLFLRLKNNEINSTNEIKIGLEKILSRILYGCYYFCIRGQHKPAKISGITKKILANINYGLFIENRKKNAEFIQNNLAKSKYTLFVSKIESIYSLTGFPILVKDRNMLLKKLHDKKVDCLAYRKFWYCSDAEIYANEKKVFEQHMLLPISEDMNRAELNYLVNTCNQL